VRESDLFCERKEKLFVP